MRLAPSSTNGTTPTPLVMSDRLLSLAREADRAGLQTTARDLIRLAYAVFDEPAGRRQTAVAPRPT